MLVWYIVIFSAVLLGFGFAVDMWYKKKGIKDVNPEENSAHVNGMERAYVESHLNHMRDDLNSNGI
ncbi:hypothetical protein [Bacillus sp. FJAT-27445]|uniref:hypothetical protein n=1 Tax=Bacillus sp. FJAT-27445 TaxID=1679166 RepID=UPI000A8184FB|nr:hypothetical protein [Bacillus sp. FJAT-27445]